MVKKGIVILFFIVTTIGTASAVTVGGMGVFEPSGFTATASSGKVEVELSITALTNSALSLSADYTLAGAGIANGFSWNVAAGAGIGISDNYFGLNIIVPVELVFKIREILNGLDIYLQAKPIVPIIPKPTFDFEVGLGVRVGL